MTERSLFTRVAVKDADQAAAALRQLGDRGEKSLKRLETSAVPASKGLIAVDKASIAAQDSLRGLAARGGAAGNVLAGMGPKGLAAAAGIGAAVLAVKELVDQGDRLKLLEGRFTALTGSTDEAGISISHLFEIAGRTGGELDSIGQQFGRFTLAARDLGATQGDVARLVQTVTELGAVGGASGQELSAGAVQLAQALASGRLQGDELRSVLENMPLVARAIAEGLGIAVGQLRDLASQGELTAAKVFDALLKKSDEADKAFAELPITTERAAGQMAAAWAEFTTEIDRSLGISNALATALSEMAKIIRPGSLEDRLAGAVVAAGRIEARLKGGGLSGIDRANSLNQLAILRERIEVLADELDSVRDVEAASRAEAEARRAAAKATDDQKKAIDRLKESDAEADALNAAIAKGLQDFTDREDERAAAVAKTTDSLDAQIAVAQTKIDAQGQDNAATEKAVKLLEIENKLRADSIILLPQERAELEKRVETLVDAERKLKALEKAEKDAAKAAEKQAELLARPFVKAADRVQEAFADALADAFEQGKIDAEDFGKALERILIRAAAEAASAMIFRPIFGGIGVAGGGGSGFGLASAAPAFAGTFGNGGNLLLSGAGAASALIFGQSQLLGQAGVSLGQSLGLGAGGQAFLGNAGLNLPYGSVGSFAASLLGLNSGNFLIDTGTGLIGAGVGGAVGGPVGAAVGAFLTTALGGLLGGGKRSVGPGAGINLIGTGGEFGVGLSGTDNGGNALSVTKIAEAAAEGANRILKQLGGTIRTTGPGEAIGGVGDIPSFGGFFTARSGDISNRTQWRGVGGRTAEETVSDEIIRLFAQAIKDERLQGVDSGVAAAIRRSAQIVDPGDLQAFTADVDLILTLFDKLPEPATQAEQAIQALNDQFDAMADRADDLGISLQRVEDRRADALTQLTTDFDATIAAQIKAIVDPVGAAFDVLEAQQEQRLKEAKALGADLVQIERLTQLERARLADQQLQGIRALRDDLTFGSLSAASPGDRAAASRTAFDRLLLSTIGGGAAAPGDAAAIIRRFVESSLDVNATGGSFGLDLTRARNLATFLENRGFAGGGIATSPSLFGEAGPEAAIPLDGGMRIPVAEIRFAGSGFDRRLADLVALNREMLAESLHAANDRAAMRADLAALKREIKDLRTAVNRSPSVGLRTA